MYSSIHFEDDQDFGPRPCSYREIHSTYVGEQEHQGKKICGNVRGLCQGYSPIRIIDEDTQRERAPPSYSDSYKFYN